MTFKKIFLRYTNTHTYLLTYLLTPLPSEFKL